MRRIILFIALVFLLLANVILAKHASTLKASLDDVTNKLDLCDLRCKK